MNILTMVTTYLFWGVLLMSTGCATTLHKDYLFQEVQKDLGDIVFHAKLRGKPTKVNKGLTVTGSPYELLIWLSPGSSTANVEDCEILFDNLALKAVDTEHIVFSKKTAAARFNQKADGKYSASFIFKNLDLEYVDYKLKLSLQSSAQCLQNITQKQLEFIFKRDYQEKQVSFWDSLMGI